MYNITIIGFHLKQYCVTLTLTLCCYKQKLSDLEITNRLLIANSCTSAASESDVVRPGGLSCCVPPGVPGFETRTHTRRPARPLTRAVLPAAPCAAF